MIMNIKQLKYFLVVAEERQITSAAKKLYIAQPPLSYQLKQLEKEVGTQLFVRNAHGIELTEEGKIFQKYAEKIVNLSLAVTSQIHQIKEGELGKIRIGVISSCGGVVPNKQFKQLINYYPSVSFEIHEANTFGIVEQLQDGILDLGIVRTPFNLEGLNSKDFYQEHMVAVANNDFLQENEIDRLSQLENKPLILYRRFQEIFNRSFRHQGIRPFYAVICDDARTAIHWADEGLGVALVPESIAHTYGKSKIIPIKHEHWITHLNLVWRKDRQVTPLMDKIIEMF